MTQAIHPILLAGGSGTRLWPVSRKAFPKQFSRFGDEETLYQQALARVTAPDFAAPLVLTNEDFRFVVGEQAREVGITPAHVLIEPEGRDTAPAILAGALMVAKANPEALILVAAADHVIPDHARFRAAVQAGAEAAKAGSIITFGIQPTRAETGYGWLELSNPASETEGTPIDLLRFVEKPTADKAEAMLAAGSFLWNSGIFLFSAATILKAYQTLKPNMFTAVSAAVEGGAEDLDFMRLDADAWSKAEKISVDFAIMEQAKDIKVVPFGGSWSDLGDWSAVWRASDDITEEGNLVTGDAQLFESENTYVHGSTSRTKLIGLGLKDMIAAATDDAVLVAHRSKTQEVKKVVDSLRKQGDKRADQFPSDLRPWGSFQSLALGSRFQVKRIEVKPGGILSLQSHIHRAEHWIVVEGTARVTVDEEVKLLHENQSVYIPLGAVHRMENPGKVPLVLIEVQTGSYLGEDDIIRYEDAYSRS